MLFRSGALESKPLVGSPEGLLEVPPIKDMLGEELGSLLGLLKEDEMGLVEG